MEKACLLPGKQTELWGGEGPVGGWGQTKATFRGRGPHPPAPLWGFAVEGEDSRAIWEAVTGEFGSGETAQSRSVLSL